MKKKYIRNKDLVWEKVDNDLVLLDYEAGKIHYLNETARLIWDFLNKKRNSKEIYDYVISCYKGGDGKMEIKRDVRRMLVKMKKLKLLI
ncbi:hypothetical protein DRH14_03145 [Candidatus Shapirobacteria bacterium]|nr:MAG: hypothetical protein DRH14_03145 [Candidatus Shapirobacteria bacterium]